MLITNGGFGGLFIVLLITAVGGIVYMFLLSGRSNYVAGGLMLAACFIVIVVIFSGFSRGKVLAVNGGIATLEGPQRHRILADFDPKKYTLKPGDVVEIELKGKRWVVVEMTRR